MTDNHFITVSKRGVLTARRKGHPPVEVARAEDGLEVQPDRPLPLPVRVYFAAGGGNREVCVLHLRVGTVDLTVDELVRQHGVSERDVGRWIRAAVDAALDRAR